MTKHPRFLPLVLVSLVCAIALPLHAQIVPRVRASATQALGEHANLARYYPDKESALRDLDSVEREAKDVRSAPTSAELASFLLSVDAVLARTRRLSAYFTLIKARDIDALDAQSAIDRADVASELITSKVRAAALQWPASAWIEVGRDPRAQRFSFLATEARERASHQIAPETKALLDRTARPTLAALWTLYQKAARLAPAIPAQSAKAGGNDRAGREAAWRGRWQNAGARAELNATILLEIVRLKRESARLAGYGDAVSAGYSERGLTRPLVRDTLEQVRTNLDLYRAYHRIRVSRLASRFGIRDVQPWDLSLLTTPPATNYSLEDARRIIPQAVAPLGPDYLAHFKALLDPAAGRLDVAMNQGKREVGGFSVSAPGAPTTLFIGAFGGTLNDLRVVAHEGGHAVAGQYANEGGTPSLLSDGPEWLMESYAILDQMLLFDYLAGTSANPSDREQFLTALIDDMMFQVFGSAEETSLEEGIYDAAGAGSLQSDADLSALGFRVAQAFEPWSPDILRLTATSWSTKRLLYQDPLYYVNYMFAGIVAINFYEALKRDPQAFAKRYRALLRRGYDAPPLELVGSALGRQPTAEALTSSAFSTIRRKMQELTAATS